MHYPYCGEKFSKKSVKKDQKRQNKLGKTTRTTKKAQIYPELVQQAATRGGANWLCALRSRGGYTLPCLQLYRLMAH